MGLDYRQFLGRTEEVTAPVLLHGVAWAGSRRLRVPGAGRGWWRLSIKGRNASALRQAQSEEVSAALSPLTKLRGHVVQLGREYFLCSGGQLPDQVLLPPGEEPPALSPLICRVWDSGDVLWGELEWETDAEERVRRVLEEGSGLSEVKGIPSSLRAAFALALAARASRTTGIQVSPGELDLRVIADGGLPAAEAALRQLEEQRRQAFGVGVRNWLMHGAPHPNINVRPQVYQAPQGVLDNIRAIQDLEGRLEESLSKSGSRLLSSRRAGNNLVEVKWLYQRTRLITMVNERTLRVEDAGICLTDHYTGERGDGELTLDSLPLVVAEAIRTGKLVITRRDGGDWED